MRRLADRSAEHLKSITDHNIHLPVAVHFNQADHSIDDYSIFGLKLTPNSHLNALNHTLIALHVETMYSPVAKM